MLKSTVYRCQTQTPISNFHLSIPKAEMLQNISKLKLGSSKKIYSLLIPIIQMQSSVALNKMQIKLCLEI